MRLIHVTWYAEEPGRSFATLNQTFSCVAATTICFLAADGHLYRVGILTGTLFAPSASPETLEPKLNSKIRTMNDLLHTLGPVARLGTPDHQEDHAYEGW